MEKKLCPKCMFILPVIEFHKNESRNSGLQSWCKGCKARCKKEYVPKPTIIPPSGPSRFLDTVEEKWIAWAAGIYEGEGSIVSTNLRKGRDFPSAGVKISVPQNDFMGEPSWVLLKFQELFGGSIILDKEYKGQVLRKWTCFSEDARDFVLAIEPYLSPRRLERVNQLREIAKLKTLSQKGGRKTYWWRTEND